MIGNIIFYRMRGSLSSGEYPLLSSGQDLSTYQVAQFPRVKYRGGMQASAELPYFQGLEDANVAEIDGSFYWVTEYRQRTAESNQYVITLDYMGPTSLYRSGDSIKGSWHKLPSNECPYMNQVISNDVMAESRYVALPKLPTVTAGGNEYPMFWFQIVGYDANNLIKRYGGFIAYDEARGLDQGTILVSPYANTYYPTYYILLANLTDLTGILAENVMDFSISERCPYPYIINQGANMDTVVLRDGAWSIRPVGGVDYALYDLTVRDYGSTDWTVTMTLSDMERSLGQLTVKDCNANNLMTISASKSATVTLSVSTFADMSGIFTVITHDEQVITIREGQLPYLSNTWATYRAYQLDTDLMQLQYNFANSRYQQETDMIVGSANAVIGGISTGVMTGAIAGNTAGAAMGIASAAGGLGVSIFESSRNLALSDAQARQNFYLSQKRAVNQPQTAYNNGYGTVYCHDSVHNTSRLSLLMPYNMTSDYFGSWCADMGYPAEGVRTVTAITGFYQGKLIDGYGGMKYDRTNEVFMRGFKFVSP